MSKPTKNIKALQKLLKAQGYNPGAIDNTWGPKTEAALESFLKDNPNIVGSSVMDGIIPDLPLPAKAFVDDFVTSQLNALPVGKAKSNAITRGDLSSNQLEALQKIVRKNLKEGKTTIGYEDYGTDFKYGDVGPSASSGNILKQLVFSPEYNLKTTLGRANIVTTPTDTLVVDQYNFNKGRGSSIFNPYAWYRTAKNIGTKPTLYTVPRKIAAQFGSQEGEGAPAIINTSEYSNGGIANSEKARKFRMMRPAQGEYYPYAGPGFTFMPEESTSTHVSSVFEANGKYFVAPTITNKKAPYAGYQPQSFEEAYRAGEAIPFDSFDEAMFFSQNYKLPKYFDNMKKFKYNNGGKTPKKKNPLLQYDPSSDVYGTPAYGLETYQNAITRDSLALEDMLAPGPISRFFGYDENMFTDYGIGSELSKQLQVNRSNRDQLKPYTQEEMQELNYYMPAKPTTDFDEFLRQYQESGINDMKNGGLWANIHAKRRRIAAGSGESMRKPGSKGAPTEEALKRSQAKYGGKVLKYPHGGKAMGRPAFKADYEAEDGEVIVGNVSLDRMYNGGMLKSYGTGGMYSLSGPTHAEGGIGIINNDSNPSYVFSNNPKLKVPKEFAKGGTYADAAKGMSKSLENIAEMRMGGEGYDRTTANLMEPLAMKEFSNLYDAQEQFKIDNNIGGNPINTAFNGGGFNPNKYQNSGFSLPTGLGLNGNTGGMQMPGNFGVEAEATGQSNEQGLPSWMIGANLLGPATNILGGLFGEAPTMDLGREQEEDYRDFSPIKQQYASQQARGLAGLRAGIQGSGATGAQLRAGVQAGTSAAQNQAGQFYTNLAQQQAESDRQTDATNRAIREQNLQREIMEDQFAAQNDPMNKLTAGIGQLGEAGAKLGMDYLRLQGLGTANYGAFGDFLKGIIE